MHRLTHCEDVVVGTFFVELNQLEDQLAYLVSEYLSLKHLHMKMDPLVAVVIEPICQLFF